MCYTLQKWTRSLFLRTLMLSLLISFRWMWTILLPDVCSSISEINAPLLWNYDPFEDRVYWTDVAQGLIISAISNATSLRIPFRCNVKVPDGLAIDHVGQNIYWTDTGTNRIEVARLDGTSRKLLIKDGLDEPRAIVLDERNGWVINRKGESRYSRSSLQPVLPRQTTLFNTNLKRAMSRGDWTLRDKTKKAMRKTRK